MKITHFSLHLVTKILWMCFWVPTNSTFRYTDLYHRGGCLFIRTPKAHPVNLRKYDQQQVFWVSYFILAFGKIQDLHLPFGT